MDKLTGKVAVITGGNSGIGYATAKELKEQGATVIITGRRKEAIEQAGAELGARAIVADQASLPAIDKLAGEVKAEFGKVDILFINAGVASLSAIENASETHFDEIMNINFKGAYFTLSKFIPLLNDGASVIFLSSIVASTNHHSSSVYSASKAALNSVMKTAAVELATRKIRVNAVSPGPTKTNVMHKAGLDEATLKQITDSLTTRIPMSRMAESEEIAKLVVYLAGDAAGFITGSEFIIDGGLGLH